MDLISLYRFTVHLQVPDFNREVVSCDKVSPTVAELHVRNTGDDLAEETPVSGVFWLLKYYNQKKNSIKCTRYLVHSVAGQEFSNINHCG